MRQELAERRESLRLHQRQREVELARARCSARTRDELSMRELIAAETAAATEERERAELAENDAVAGARHLRAQAAS